MHTLVKVIPVGVTMFSPKPEMYLTKPLWQSWEAFFLVFGQGLQNNKGDCHFSCCLPGKEY